MPRSSARTCPDGTGRAIREPALARLAGRPPLPMRTRATFRERPFDPEEEAPWVAGHGTTRDAGGETVASPEAGAPVREASGGAPPGDESARRTTPSSIALLSWSLRGGCANPGTPPRSRGTSWVGPWLAGISPSGR